MNKEYNALVHSPCTRYLPTPKNRMDNETSTKQTKAKPNKKKATNVESIVF